jgi:putative membrane protein
VTGAEPSAPARTAPEVAARRLHPLSPVFDLFDRNLLAPGIIALGSGAVRLLVLAVAAYGLYRVVSWRRRTYALDAGVLRVEGGVLARSEQLVPCDRIQQVNLVQKLRHRLFGLAALRVEVAGGGRGSGVELDVLGLAEATSLRRALLAAKADVSGAPAGTDPAAGAVGSAVTDGPGPAGHAPGRGAGGAGPPSAGARSRPIVRLSNRQLVVAGLTGSELFVVFALAASALQAFDGIPERVWRTAQGIEGGVAVAVALGVAFVLVWLGAAIATSVLRDAGYALDVVEDELHLSRGLLDRKEAVLPLARVQAVVVTASPLRRPLGYVSLRVRSASAGADQEERRVSVPILPVDQLPAVLELLLPGSAAVPALRPAAPAARRRAVVRWTWPVALVAAAVAWLAFPTGLLALLALPPAVAAGLAAYRGLGHAVGPAHLTARSGALVRRTVVVPLERAQSTRVRSSPFQRRLGLATCVVDVAGPGRKPSVVDVDEAVAQRVAGRAVAAAAGR